MAQNIYDQDDFFAGYSQLRRSQEGLAGAPEWPSLRAMLPELAGKRVLDLGCGFGWFCRWAREQGAAEVTGIDVSEKMLTRARETARDPVVAYAQGDMETLSLLHGAFDLVYSSLALHYIKDVRRLFGEIHASLTAGGAFVFSTEHPLFMAPSEPRWQEQDGHKTWPLDSYLKEGERRTDWLAKGVVKYHRSLGTTLNALIGAGFTLTHVEEWGPTDAQIAENPMLAEERDRPTFLLVSATA
jgi:2-polyprenyl-3-methyl-5-hydroxy-6-metoxy-1,4-benzoquinol methylase